MNDFDLDDILSDNDSDAPIPFDNAPNAPIPFNDDPNAPIPFDDSDDDDSSVSHSPLELGGSKTEAEPLEIEPLTEPAPPVRPAPAGTPSPVASGERIVAVKMFFAKLHAGSLDFLGEQIKKWLKKNPDVVIKQTNTSCGTIIAKKAEPSLIITIWY